MTALTCKFLAFYMLMLAFLPCSDGEHEHEQPSGPASAALFSADEHGCPSHEHCADACSPLCGCQCCSTAFDFRAVAPLAPPSPVFFQKHLSPVSCDAFPQQLSEAIDHPPQLRIF